ncbi:MAG: VWA domain-containing protein [Chloroflexi bacterium]|nr:VWA domain-containing protein [Chloroflexota bacterium]
MGIVEYSRWDGSQRLEPFDAGALLDEMADELLAGRDPRRLLQRIQRAGLPRQGLEGLRGLLNRLKDRRQQSLQRYNIGSALEDIKRELAEILRIEQAGLEQRQQPTIPPEGMDPELAERLQQAKARMAQAKKEQLADLPPDLAGQMRGLEQYEFMEPEAQQRFQALRDRLKQQVANSNFDALRQAMQGMGQGDMQALREMLQDLNQMLRDRAEGKPIDFDGFMQQHGHHFGPGIENLDQLVERLGQQMNAMQSLLNSMSPSQRQELWNLMQQMMGDDALAKELAELGQHLYQELPDFGQPYEFSGDEDVSLDQALDQMDHLSRLDQLEQQLEEARQQGSLRQVDRNELGELLGEESRLDLEQLESLQRLLEEAGLLEQRGNRLELTAAAIRRIAQKALRDIFVRIAQDRAGQHETVRRGGGGERTDESKPYAFGDPFLLDLQGTLRQAIYRRGPGLPIQLSPDDFAVFRTEQTARAATVLCIDLSRSMLLRDCFLAAKKVTLALHSLIKGQFPRDALHIIGFGPLAQELDPEALFSLQIDGWSQGTNLEHALILARQKLAKYPGATRQIIVVTDGEPTAHLTDDGPVFSWPPMPETYRATLRQVLRCTRDRIIITTFMLDAGEGLEQFVEEMTELNRGRAFYAEPDRLGEYILVDYVQQKRGRVHG